MCDDEYYYTVKLRGLADIPNNQTVAIRIHDIKLSEDSASASENTAFQKLYKSQTSMVEFLKTNPPHCVSIRAIHICQLNSYSELLINSACLNELITRHGIMRDFELITSHFVSRRVASESAFCGPILQRSTMDIFEISYIFKYPELKDERDEKSWAIRQIGVYQQYSMSTKKSVWIFLHCQQGSRGQKLITKFLEEATGARSAYRHPAALHLLLLSCYLYRWQKYMAFYEKELLTRFNTALGARLEDIPRTSYDTISRVRFLEDRFAPLPSIFASLRTLFDTLETTMPELSSHDTPYKSQLASHSSFVKSCESNVRYLMHRCNALSQFIVESSSHTQNGLIVQDSQSIRVITVLTLIYLPASFTATFFGMQFFASMTLTKLWIFFLSAGFLTLLTLGGWWWSTSRLANIKTLAMRRYSENRSSLGYIDV